MFEAFRTVAERGAAAPPAVTQRGVAHAPESDAPSPKGHDAPRTSLPLASPVVPRSAPASARPSLDARHGAAPELDAYGPGFLLPFSGVTFLVLQVGLLAVAFYLGLLSGRDVAAAGPAAGPDDQGAATIGLDLGGPDLGGPNQADGRVAGAAPRGRGADVARGRGLDQAAAGALGDRAGARGATGGSGAPQPAPATAPVTAADPLLAAFLDPTNVFTLQLVSYDDTASGRELAKHWLGVLRAQNLPAVLRQVGQKLTLCVGASPNAVGIEELRGAVRDIRGTRGERVFVDPRVMPLRDFR